MIELTCSCCGKQYKVFSSNKNRKYCSSNCYHEDSKGRVPWNKGKKLGILSEEHKRKIGIALKGHSVLEETKRNISNSLKKWYASPEGKTQLEKWSEDPKRKENLLKMTTLSHTQEANEKRTQSRKGYRHSKETRQKIGWAHKGKKLSDQTKQKLSLLNNGNKHSENTKQKISMAIKKRIATPKGQKQFKNFIAAAREKNIERWKKGTHPLQKPENRARALAASLETNYKKLKEGTHVFQNPETRIKSISMSAQHNYGQTWIEKQVAKLLDEMNLKNIPQKRISNGVDVLGGRKYLFPDFFLPQHNLIIECDGEYWHQNKEREKERDTVFIKKGYKVLHLKGKEIREDLESCRIKIEHMTV